MLIQGTSSWEENYSNPYQMVCQTSRPPPPPPPFHKSGIDNNGKDKKNDNGECILGAVQCSLQYAVRGQKQGILMV